MPIVRTTIQPHVELEVGDAEYLDLQRQGLLIEDAPATPPAAAPAKSPVSAKAKDA